MKPKILITGSQGQLGSELQDLAPQFPQFVFHFFSRSQLSITDEQAVSKIFSDLQPQFVVNCAAYTAVDKAEEEKAEAIAINATAVGVLAEAANTVGARFVHISTDYVFDGLGQKPWTEDDVTNPVNFYGATKLEGEKLALAKNQQSVVIRTSWVYSAYGKNFVKTMLKLMAERDLVRVVADQYGTPTYAADLAKAIMAIITSDSWTPGIFHFSNEGAISWADFATEIRNQVAAACQVEYIPTEAFPTPARRPQYSVLDKSKIQRCYPVTVRPWQEGLADCLQLLK